MAGKPNAQIIGGARASLPIEVYAYVHTCYTRNSEKATGKLPGVMDFDL